MTYESTRQGYGSNESLDRFLTQEDNAPEKLQPDGWGLIEFVCDSLAILWKDWPRDMKLNVLDANSFRYSLSGTCPHCYLPSVFIRVTDPYRKDTGYQQCLLTAVMECQGCQRCILSTVGIDNDRWEYLIHYPLEAPDDSVAPEVTAANPVIATDFAEARRCFSVKAYKASVAMCRRSIEATCKHFGAKGRDLQKKIDKLAEMGKITEPLKDIAHTVRLSANRQLHGKKLARAAEPDPDNVEIVDDLDTCGEDEAAAMIEFTKELFQHVFVMPAKLKIYSKPNPQGEAADPDNS